jgi:DNA-3-methyladenine glycosylase
MNPTLFLSKRHHFDSFASGGSQIVAPKLKASIVPQDFYSRSPEIVARDLLGKLLIRHLDGERLTGRIIEVEAYLGLSDPASHAATGLTPNNAVLFGPPGRAHVYFIYGMHYCISISCLPIGNAGGVLIRALDPLEGFETMARLRGVPSNAKPGILTGGPGRLCQAMGITRAIGNGLDVTRLRSILQIADDGTYPDTVEVTPRIGIRKAVDRPLRFLVPTLKTRRQD